MILNETYYQKLLEKFNDVQHLETNFSNNVIALTVKIILKHYQENKPIHINFQNSKQTIFEIGEALFLELSNDIYKNHYDFPVLAVGSKLRDKRKHRDGKKHDWIVKSISKDNYKLEHIKNKAQSNFKFDNLIDKFIPIEQGTRQTTLQAYTKFFTDLNKDLDLEFTPTYFEKKSVFITKKPLWDSLRNKNKIPSTYLPNPNEGNEIHAIKSIPALADCICYFTPKYSLCYDNLLMKNKKIKSIIVFDTEASNIEQMIIDKKRFGFNLIVLSNSLLPQKNTSIPCWNWFKEEIDIVNKI